MSDAVLRTVSLAEVHPAANGEPLPLLRAALAVPAGSSSLPARTPAAAGATAARRQLGECVRTARMATHLTQAELAGPDYSKSYLSAVERGKIMPSFQALLMLAERLGVTRAFLLGEDPPQLLLGQETPGEGNQQQAEREALEALLREERYEEALALCAESGRIDWSSDVRAAYAQFLAAQGRFADAYDQMAKAFREAQGKATTAR